MPPAAYRFFLDQLATLLKSGIPIRQALSMLERVAPSPRIAERVERLGQRIQKGATLSEAMAAHPCDFPRAHAAVVGAAERAGAIGWALIRLRDEVDRRIAVRRALLSRSAYPILILALVAILIPLPLLVAGRIGSYVGLEMLVFGAALGLLYLAYRWRERAVLLLSRSAFVGGIIRRATLGESLSLLGLLVEAGIGVEEALELAAGAARSPELAAELRGAALGLAAGRSLSESLIRVTEIPPAARGTIATGEQAGAMDRALQEAGRSLEEDAWRNLERVLGAVPIALYILAMGLVVVLYANAILGYFSRLGGLG